MRRSGPAEPVGRAGRAGRTRRIRQHEGEAGVVRLGMIGIYPGRCDAIEPAVGRRRRLVGQGWPHGLKDLIKFVYQVV